MIPQVATYILAALVLLASGGLAGWFYGDKGDEITKSRLRTGVAIIVTAMWAVTIVAEIVIPTYTTAMVIHAIMGAVVGYLFSEQGLQSILGN